MLAMRDRFAAAVHRAQVVAPRRSTESVQSADGSCGYARDESSRRHVAADDRASGHNRTVADRYAPEDGRTGADPEVGADMNRRECDARTAISNRCGLTGRQEADVRAEHGVFADVVERAPVVQKHVGPHPNAEAVVTMDRRYQPKPLVDRSTRQL